MAQGFRMSRARMKERRMMVRFTSVLTFTAAVCCWSPLRAVAQCTFAGVGDLPGGVFRSNAFDVSADGSVVVGESHSDLGWQAFRWTAEDGMVGLGDLPGGIFSSQATGVSADGSVIVGRGNPEGGLVFEACRWTAEGGIEGLGFLPGEGPDSMAFCVSADGSVIGGRAWSTDFGMDIGLRWTADEGMVSLGVLDNGKPTRGAWGVSADGSVMVGAGGFPNKSPEAYRWTALNGALALGFLPGGDVSGITAITPDGLIAFGGSNSAQGPQLVRWTQGEGMIGLGVAMNAKDVTADGSIVVGNDVDFQGATIWDAENGMRFLQDVLVMEHGLDLTGWVLEEAWGISADGSTIIGRGFNPDGNREGWIARIGQCECSWDLDGSGSVGVKDLLFLLGAWGSCPPKGDCPADFDNTGDVGVKDLLVLLGNWGPCP